MILLLPFVLQGMALVVDEIYFHYRRVVPLWERIGHPLDTTTVLACYLWIYLCPTNAFNLQIYIGLAAFSCLFVTKDEFVHAKHCDAGENWLHAVLFLLHPITFLVAGFLWWQNADKSFLNIQILMISLFLAYQLLYWNVPWKKILSK